MTKPGALLRGWLTLPDATVRLVLISHAGGGAATYRFMASQLKPEIECHSVQLPGREDRLAESPAASLTAVAQGLAGEIVRTIMPPYAIFGHSMGGLVAYEVAYYLVAKGSALPTRLFLSGCRPPHLPRRTATISELPEKEFVAAVQRLYGELPPALLNAPDFLQIFMSVLRGDLRLMDAHARGAPEALPIPINLFGGERDRAVTPEELRGWSNYSSVGTSVRFFPGGHFYLNDQRVGLCDAIAEQLLSDAADVRPKPPDTLWPSDVVRNAGHPRSADSQPPGVQTGSSETEKL